MFYSINLLGNGAAILLIVLGLINFVNVMLTGVIARKNEFAIMESIGTTKKQIKKILTLEGGIYAIISTILIMTFGKLSSCWWQTQCRISLIMQNLSTLFCW